MRICYAKPDQGVTVLAGVDMMHWSEKARQIWLKKPGEIQVVDGAESALVSETFARRFDVLEGGVVEIETPSGKRRSLHSGYFVIMEMSSGWLLSTRRNGSVGWARTVQ